MINRMIANMLPFLPERFIWVFSKKYIAGKEFSTAIKCIRELQEEKTLTTIDVLGESIETTEEADLYFKKYLQTIDGISENQLDSSISIKPTMFGLQWNPDYCHQSLRKIISFAAERNLFVRIDMEDSSCTSLELELFEKLYKEFPGSVGIVLQSYLKRTLSDIDRLKLISVAEHPVNIRLCKGIYIESRNIAYKGRDEIRDNFIKCLEKILSYDFYPALATHDRKLVYECLDLIKKAQRKREEYEFQMLLGVTPRLRRELIKKQHRMRVYVPYGEKWFRYATRRLQENPNMVWTIIRGIFFPN